MCNIHSIHWLLIRSNSTRAPKSVAAENTRILLSKCRKLPFLRTQKIKTFPGSMPAPWSSRFDTSIYNVHEPPGAKNVERKHCFPRNNWTASYILKRLLNCRTSEIRLQNKLCNLSKMIVRHFNNNSITSLKIKSLLNTRTEILECTWKILVYLGENKA